MGSLVKSTSAITIKSLIGNVLILNSVLKNSISKTDLNFLAIETKSLTIDSCIFLNSSYIEGIPTSNFVNKGGFAKISTEELNVKNCSF